MKHLISGKTVNIKNNRKEKEFTLTHSSNGLTFFLKGKDKNALINTFKQALKLDKLISKAYLTQKKKDVELVNEKITSLKKRLK